MAGRDLGLLAADGGRRTPARRTIVEACVAAGGALTADGLTARVQDAAPEINQSTVYRVLEALEAVGAADRADVGKAHRLGAQSAVQALHRGRQPVFQGKNTGHMHG